MPYLIHEGRDPNPLCRAEDEQTALDFAALCASQGRTVRVVEEGRTRGRTFKKNIEHDA